MKKHSLRLTGLATTTMLLALAGCDSTGPAKDADDGQATEESGLPPPMPAPESTPDATSPETVPPEKNAMPGAPPPPGDLPPTQPPPTANSAQ